MRRFLQHFLFRLQQGLRIFNLNPKVGFSVVFFVGALICIKLPIPYLPAIAMFITASLHVMRKDVKFLQKVFIQSWRLIFILEGFIVFSFFLLINIHYKFEVYGYLGMLATVLFGFLYPETRVRFIMQWNIIPDELFEWRSYFRKHSLLIIPFFIGFIASAYHPAALIFLTFILLDSFAMVYEKNENKEMLMKYFQSTDFKTKLKKNLSFLNLLLAPVIVLFLYFNPNEIIVLGCYIVFMNLYLALILSRKYKLYNHKKSSTYFDMGDSLLYFCAALAVIPGLLIIGSNYKQAAKNISSYVGN